MKTSSTISVISQATKVLDNINVTLEFVTTPTIPLLGTTFLQAVNTSSSEVSLIGNDDVFALRCTTEKSAHNVTECFMEDTSTCSPTETDANCQCRNINITEKAHSVESRLPLSSSVLYLQDIHGRIQGLSHEFVADLTIGTSVQYQTDNLLGRLRDLRHTCISTSWMLQLLRRRGSHLLVFLKAADYGGNQLRTPQPFATHPLRTQLLQYTLRSPTTWKPAGSNVDQRFTTSPYPEYLPTTYHGRNPTSIKETSTPTTSTCSTSPTWSTFWMWAIENWKTAIMTFVAVAVFVGVGTLMIPKLVSKLVC
ncbi:hypothetical protein Y032_0028g1765 [Ancylostoma ceylanicum]|uniref:Phlebovirus glycoprotein G2 fusion domain-containing protein n=1 Tax=Ancylostoma ceylanicum TaxID=53326 RepID=A0A016UUW3_9BILA|nr:hypothetical protein Y032_0028g1765 [Ancylostoma ceylanicum]